MFSGVGAPAPAPLVWDVDHQGGGAFHQTVGGQSSSSKILYCLRKLKREKENENKISSCRSNYTGNIEAYTPKDPGADGRSHLRNVVNTRSALEDLITKHKLKADCLKDVDWDQ